MRVLGWVIYGLALITVAVVLVYGLVVVAVKAITP